MAEGAYKLIEEKATEFHSIEVKLLWVMKRSRPDIETAIYFLCTGVKDLDIYYWEKLIQVLKLLNQTTGGNQFIGADNI